MNESEERTVNSALITQEKNLPDEYVKRASELLNKREKSERALRDALPPTKGIDDRLNMQLLELDRQLRTDLANLRKEYGIKT